MIPANRRFFLIMTTTRVVRRRDEKRDKNILSYGDVSEVKTGLVEAGKLQETCSGS